MILHRQVEAEVLYQAIIGSKSATTAWQRVEQWIAWRWDKRDVTWLVEGAGMFKPPLTPWALKENGVKVWDGSDWQTTDSYCANPLGINLPGGLYQIEAEAGNDDQAPEAVCEAVRRLRDYMLELEQPGVKSHTETLDKLTVSVSRSERAAARALELSGAADLLRPWRYA